MKAFLEVEEFSSDKGGWFEVPETLPPARLLPHVVETQLDKLEPLLGVPLLGQLGVVLAQARADAAALDMAAPSEEPTPYADMLAEPWASLWASVKPVLGYYSWARFLPFAQTTVTSHSHVVKTTDNSTPASNATVNSQVITLLDTAQSYQARLLHRLQMLAPQLATWKPYQASCLGPEPGPQGTVTTLLINRPRRR